MGTGWEVGVNGKKEIRKVFCGNFSREEVGVKEKGRKRS